MRDETCAAGRVAAEIPVHFVPDDPFGADGVEDGEERDEVGVFADTPLVVVLLRRAMWRRGSGWFDPGRIAIIQGKGAPDAFLFVVLHVISEGGVVVAVQFGDIKPGIALPDAAAGLFAPKLGKSLGQLVVVAGEPSINLPVPHKFILRVLQCEVLDRQPLGMMDTGRS